MLDSAALPQQKLSSDIPPIITDEAYLLIDLAAQDGLVDPAAIQRTATEFRIDVPAETIALAALVGSMNRHPTNTRLTPETTMQKVDKIKSSGYAFTAPTMEVQCIDGGRNNIISFNRQNSDTDTSTGSTTEVNAIRELRGFLAGAYQELAKRVANGSTNPNDIRMCSTARSLLERTSYIGDKEYKTSANIIGAYWKEFLDSDPRNKVYVLTGISDSEKYPGQIKSDQYLYNIIADTYGFMSPSSQYTNRIVNGTDGLEGADMEHTKVVLLDDWALSGSQLSRVYFSLKDNPSLRKFLPIIEANLIVAQRSRIISGLNISRPAGHRGSGTETANLGVKAVYMASDALVQTHESGGSHISGSHSSANYGFSLMLDELYRYLKSDKKYGRNTLLPALANIERPYKTTSTLGNR